jgi:hypothetical protein
MEEFLGGGKLKVDKVATLQFARDEVVKRAKTKLNGNFSGYSFFDNNCEHFAFWCGTAKRTSRQVYFANDDQDIVEKTIDRIGDPLIRFGDRIDKLFGWGDHK